MKVHFNLRPGRGAAAPLSACGVARGENRRRGWVLLYTRNQDLVTCRNCRSSTRLAAAR